MKSIFERFPVLLLVLALRKSWCGLPGHDDFSAASAAASFFPPPEEGIRALQLCRGLVNLDHNGFKVDFTVIKDFGRPVQDTFHLDDFGCFLLFAML